jgi:hypothetical protein
MGTTVGPTAARAVSRLPRGSVLVFSIPYPAAKLADIFYDPSGFFQSLYYGARLLRDEVHRIGVRCPNARIAIIGYSQGAGAASDGVRMMTSADRGRIAALVLYADTFSKGQSGYSNTLPIVPPDFGRPVHVLTRGGHGVFGARSIPLDESRIVDACFAIDLVCANGRAEAVLNAFERSIHSQYKSWWNGILPLTYGAFVAGELQLPPPAHTHGGPVRYE